MNRWMRVARVIALVGANWWAWGGVVQADSKGLETTAFYYGQDLPRELARAYDQIVVQPEHAGDPAQIRSQGAEPVAYFSVGEVAPAYASALEPGWVLARNEAWGSVVGDLAQPGYRAFLLERYEALWKRGYQRFFLDTLDSYQLGAKTDAARAVQRRGILDLLQAMKSRHATVQLIINRGFELLPEIAPLVRGVVAESLFDRWDAGQKRYTRVPEADRTWLLAQLRAARDRYRLPVTVIDYRPPSERDAARETARRILRLGFEPWVCNGDLSNVGIGRYEILPRRVLLLTDTPVKDGAALERGALDWLAPILEYLGYVPELRSVHAGLPSGVLAGRYAGVITWFEGNAIPNEYGRWLSEQVKSGSRFALFGALGFDPTSAVARELGFRLAGPTPLPARPSDAGSIVSRDALIGFESEPPQHPVPGTGLTLEGDSVSVHLRALDQAGQPCDAIATAAWGGFASSHVFGLRGLQGERAWSLDPFAFLTRALRLPAIPVPDVTTENGRRLALFAIETQGAGERARLRGRPYTWAVLRDEVLEPSGWPHALSGADREADRDAEHALLQLPAAYQAHLAGGETRAPSSFGSLTQVQAMATPQPGGLGIPAPIAWDSAYVPPGAESYPYQRVLETLAFTDAPRRLKPIALHYHAYTAASPAGLESLKQIYGWVSAREVLPIRVEQYTARVEAFRDQVLARDLDGAFRVFGGEALRTLRVPAELGLPDLAASNGVAAVRTLEQGRYVSFAGAGPRKLVLGAAALDRPHVVEANAQLSRFEDRGAGSVALEVSAPNGLRASFAGLARAAQCVLRIGARKVRGRTRDDGSLQLEMPGRTSGQAVLDCGAKR